MVVCVSVCTYSLSFLIKCLMLCVCILYTHTCMCVYNTHSIKHFIRKLIMYTYARVCVYVHTFTYTRPKLQRDASSYIKQHIFCFS
uniref:Uncharacterized protein n=1 Tax=Crocodylus porosus TaxID=8502 RepID=A0A7M4EVZ9_CROPO